MEKEKIDLRLEFAQRSTHYNYQDGSFFCLICLDTVNPENLAEHFGKHQKEFEEWKTQLKNDLNENPQST